MKKQILILAGIIVLFAACKKDDNTTTTPITPTTDGFTWKEDGGAEIKADSAFWTTWASGTGVRAYKGGMTNFFEINWSGANNTATGTYTLTSGGGITFLKGADTYTNTAKEVLTITAFTADKLSGNFTTALSGGSVKNVSVTFTNLPKRL
jgi:hypothetical protein